MVNEEFEEYKHYCKQNKGKVVKDNSKQERLMLSSHRYSEHHETVVEAALWAEDELNYSNYQTFISRELDNGGSGRGSIVNDGTYTKTRKEAIEWLEDKAQEFDGSSLEWEQREVVEFHWDKEK